MPATILLFSGGLDSTVLLWDLLDRGQNVYCLTLDFGQQKMELARAKVACEKLEVHHTVIDLAGLRDHWIFPITPFATRELMLACGMMEALQCEAVTLAVGARMDVVASEWPLAAARYAQASHPEKVAIYAPYANKPKADIIRIGRRLRAPMYRSWSCVENGRKHCGLCRACKSRQHAFREAHVRDSTEYASAMPATLPFPTAKKRKMIMDYSPP